MPKNNAKSKLQKAFEKKKAMKKIDKLDNGMYRIEKDSLEEEVSLDEGEAITLEQDIRQNSQSADIATSDDITPSVEDINDDPRFNRNPLERNLGSNMTDIEFTHPDLRGYWASDEHIPRYLNWGYSFALPKDVKDFNRLFSEMNPGQGLTPDGKINFNGLTLLVATKDIAQKKHDYFYNQRIRAEEIQGNLNRSEMAQRGLK